MSTTSRPDFAAPRRDDRGARRDQAPPRASAVISSRSLVARLGCGEFLVRPIPQGPDDEGRSFLMSPFNYRPTARSGRESLIVTELEDPEDGCRAPGYEGLACSCAEYSRSRPCDHIVELTAVGLLRPAPPWFDEVLDLVQLAARADDDE